MRKLIVVILLLGNLMTAQNELTHDVYFDTDEYVVPDTEKSRLLLFIRELQDKPVQKIAIYGFCDDRGSDTYNLTLSQQRADAIKLLFTQQGVNDSIISNVDGKGEVLLKIVNTENTEVIRGLNRKVEIIAQLKIKKASEKKVAVSEEKKTVEETLKGDLKEGDTIVLENILFEIGYSTVIPESRKTLEKIAKILVEREDIYFTIQGHVCCTQNARDAIDMKTKKRNLSVARARYIYNYLIKKGVNKKRMRYVGMRRKFPLGGDPKFDRRVEIVITYVGENDH